MKLAKAASVVGILLGMFTGWTGSVAAPPKTVQIGTEVFGGPLPVFNILDSGAYCDAMEVKTPGTIPTTFPPPTPPNYYLLTPDPSGSQISPSILDGTTVYIQIAEAGGTTTYPLSRTETLSTTIDAIASGVSTITVHDPATTAQLVYPRAPDGLPVNAGSGYVENEVATFGPYATVGVKDVNGSGQVIQWVLQGQGTPQTAAPTTPLIQTASTGSGTGLQVNVKWVATGAFVYGHDDQATITTWLNNELAIYPNGFKVTIPPNRACGLASTLVLPPGVTFIGADRYSSGFIALARLEGTGTHPSDHILSLLDRQGGFGGGLRDLYVEGFKSVDITCKIEGGFRAYYENVDCWNGIKSEWQYGIDPSGTGGGGDNEFNHIGGGRDPKIFPNANDAASQGLEVTNSGNDSRFVATILNCDTIEINNDGGVDRFFSPDLYCAAPYQPQYGIVSNTLSVFYDPQVGNASAAAIHFVGDGGQVLGGFGQWGNSLTNPASGAPAVGVLIDNRMRNIRLTNFAASTLDGAQIIVQSGIPGEGSIVCNNVKASYTTCPLTARPQGRLTLQSGAPVQTSDQVNKSTIYLDSYVGNIVPVYDGSLFRPLVITGDEISMGLSSTGTPPIIAAGSVYDVFAINYSGVLTLCAGPAWTSTLLRGTGAGTTEYTRLSGLIVNKNQLDHCYGGPSGTTDYGGTLTNPTPIPADQATYLGSFYATADGQTGVALGPNAASGGANNFVAVYNAYNSVPTVSVSRDSHAAWTCTTCGTWEAADHSNNNRITLLDGLQINTFNVTLTEPVANVSGNQPQLGALLDSTSASPTGASYSTSAAQTMAFYTLSVQPQLGLHYIQAMQMAGSAGAATFSPSLTLNVGWNF